MKPKRILMVHNYYRQSGGEDHSYLAEADLLRQHGHEVITHTRSNHEIHVGDLASKLGLLVSTIWARESYQKITDLIRQHRPEIVHFQNIFPLVSPSAYYASKRMGVTTVQTLRNYRMACVNAILYRSGMMCEDCVGKVLAWPGVAHKCYRGSRSQSAAVASMLLYHRARRTWTDQVDHYIALTEFGRSIFVRSGIPAAKISIKPNYVNDPGEIRRGHGYVACVSRLEVEKGILLLLEAWQRLSSIPLKLVGGGSMQQLAGELIREHRLNVELLGQKSHSEVMKIIGESAFVVSPTLLHESFGRSIVEAFASGKPVIATRGGAARDLVVDGQTGLLFTWNEPADLSEQVKALWLHDRRREEMAAAARQEYLSKYTPQRNYEQLLDAYERAVLSGQ